MHLLVWLGLSCPSRAAGLDEVHRGEVRLAIAEHLGEEGPIEELVARIDGEAERIEAELARTGASRGAGARYAEQVAASLRDKAVRGLRLERDVLAHTVIDYEAFKLSTYVTSGVFPKRYFGFFDGRSDTAATEISVMRTVRACVGAINGWQAQQDRPVRLTEAEVAVTFYAEGGALWLGEGRPLHPVFDVGLDDLASGVADSPGAIAAIDRAAGTGLGSLVVWVEKGAATLPVPSSLPNHERWLQHRNGEIGPFPYLVRAMTIEEAVAGTALMYLWEKERADRLLAEEGRASIVGRPLDEQFVIGSLVYNSGLLHSSERWREILAFSTGRYLKERSDNNRARRPELNLLAPPAQLAELIAVGEYREQPTSWVAVYHVLQRYGAFVALRRFTDRFDGSGAFASIPELPPEAPPEAPASSPEPSPVPEVGAERRRCGCASAPLGAAGWLCAAGITGARRGRRRARRTDSAPPRDRRGTTALPRRS